MKSVKQLIDEMRPGPVRAMYSRIYYNLDLAIAQEEFAPTCLDLIAANAEALKTIIEKKKVA